MLERVHRSVVGLRGELTGSRGRSALPDSLSGFAPRTPSGAQVVPPLRATHMRTGRTRRRFARQYRRASGGRKGGSCKSTRADPPTAAGVLSSPAPRARTAWLFHAVKTYVATPSTRERNWLLVDANGQTLGRLATQIADALRGKTARPPPSPQWGVRRRDGGGR